MAMSVSAQKDIESVTVLDWDGSQLTDGTLYIGVGEKRELQLAVQPEDADRSAISLGMEMLDGDENLGSPASFYGMTIYGNREGTRHLYIYANRQQMASVAIVVSYVTSGMLYPEGTQEGQVYYSLNAKGQLQFWADALDNPKPDYSETTYNIPNYESASDAPWYEWRKSIKEVLLDNLDNIGSYAFNDLTNISSVSFPSDIQSLGDYVFLGCSNLRTLEVQRFDSKSQPVITVPSGVSLITENSNPQNPMRVEAVIVNTRDSEALEMYSSENMEWSQCGKVVNGSGYVNDTYMKYAISPAQEGGLELTVSLPSWAEEDAVLADRGTNTYPWDELGDLIEDLHITDRIRYIGADVFSTLTNLQKIQFNQSTAPLDSIHLWAFSWDIRPWKFAFGDPQDGPVFPPKVTGVDYDSEAGIKEALDTWYHFFENTVLYVPDSAFMHNNELVRAIDLYRADPIWGQAFNRLTDRTVESDSTNENEVVLKWLPLENAVSYRLTIRKKDCADCVATLEIPATGIQGLVDWTQIINTSGVARRAPREDEHGGMTLVISIQEGSGTAHNTDVEVSVTGMEPNQVYTFTREVNKVDGTDVALSKSGTFMNEANAIENIYATDLGETKIFDILGRLAGNSIEALPNGIYILSEGESRIKIILRR